MWPEEPTDPAALAEARARIVALGDQQRAILEAPPYSTYTEAQAEFNALIRTEDQGVSCLQFAQRGKQIAAAIEHPYQINPIRQRQVEQQVAPYRVAA